MGQPLNNDRNVVPPLWRRQFTITPSDTVDLTTYSHGLWVTGAGDVAVVSADDDTVEIYTLPANSFLGHVCVRRVNLTATTATGIKGGY